jgi:C1A family cysteine protease
MAKKTDKIADAVKNASADLRRAFISALGYLPDPPDPRDWISDRLIPRGLQLPLSADLRAGCSPVEDQGKLGSCTAQAGVGALEYFDFRKDGKASDLSRLALYYWTRTGMGTEKEDSGATIRDTLKQMSQGVCLEALFPYDVERFQEAPPAEADADRPNHRALEFYRSHPLRQSYMAKAALAQGLPVLCGVRVYDSFMSEETAKSGVVRMPRIGEDLLGGHAILLVGYDDMRDVFIFRNSWGASWGAKGYGELPQNYVSSIRLTSDMWIVRAATEV